MIPKPLGDQELALMQWLADRGGATVGEAAEEYGAPRGLARSTVLTMMERLRGKGHLERRPVDGVFRYESAASSSELLQGVVASFVEKTLGGSLSPFVTYLSEAPVEVSASELAELEALVARLQARRGEP
ncbi:MAG: BlaI/MecI/CopY family transcriptional regulator [Thermoanaerobaculia bacterium]|jgi:predicted transcriptional regulator|nr:BlaI/MecI/CopY family transcriptional regulator [Thermoanaerobaculia bacterium]